MRSNEHPGNVNIHLKEMRICEKLLKSGNLYNFAGQMKEKMINLDFKSDFGLGIVVTLYKTKSWHGVRSRVAHVKKAVARKKELKEYLKTLKETETTPVESVPVEPIGALSTPREPVSLVADYESEEEDGEQFDLTPPFLNSSVSNQSDLYFDAPFSPKQAEEEEEEKEVKEPKRVRSNPIGFKEFFQPPPKINLAEKPSNPPSRPMVITPTYVDFKPIKIKAGCTPWVDYKFWESEIIDLDPPEQPEMESVFGSDEEEEEVLEEGEIRPTSLLRFKAKKQN